MPQKSAVERRTHRRLDIELPVEFYQPEGDRMAPWHTVTKNICTGGAYFDTTVDDIKVGDQLSLSFAIPDYDRRFPSDGEISTVGQVVRVDRHAPDSQKTIRNAPPHIGLAIKFCESLKLSL